jgi:SPP1 family predicted phage head-tail adaptor
MTVTTWTDVATVWASVEDLTGREYQAAQATQNPVQTRIRIRYRAGIVASMRALYGNVIYNIEAVLDRDGGRVELQLMCTKGLNNG